MSPTRAKIATTERTGRSAKRIATNGPAPWQDRVEAADWDTIRGELDSYGCALTGPLLGADETSQIAALYDDDSRFRSTINMGRYRFGEANTATSPNRSPTP